MCFNNFLINMRYCILLLVSFLWVTSLFSQTIKVRSSEDKTPIDGVAIFNEAKTITAITDFDGNADISAFSNNEKLIFQHISHILLTVTKAEVMANNNLVILFPDESALDEIVLSVSKFGQQKKDVTQKVVTITSKDVLFQNPGTAADLLQNSGSVFVQKSQLGGGSPLIRGFSTNRLLIAVDGVRFNNAIFRGGNVQNVISIDPFAIERTEVILGPGSVVYGSDAIGGVMNFYTKRPKFSFEDGIVFSGSATARYGTATDEQTGHIDFNIGTKEWGFLTSVTYSDFGDIRMGKHGPDEYLRPEYVVTIDGVDTVVQNEDPRVEVPTGYNQINFMQKVRFNPTEYWDFNLGVFYTTTSAYPRYDRLITRRNGQLRSAEWFYDPQQWFSTNLQITSTQLENIDVYDTSTLSLSYQRSNEGRNDRDFGETILFETDEQVDAFTGGWDFTKKAGNATFFYGAEYVYNKVSSEGQQTDITTGNSVPDISRYPDGATWQSIAGYVNSQWKINPEITFQGGLRYNQVIVNASFVGPFYNFPFTEADINTGALTGSAGVSWNPNEVIGWKASLSTAFRAPNIDDIGKIFDSEPGSVVVPNPDLNPEFATTGEIGTTLNFDGKVKMNFSGYYTVLDDALVRRDFSINGETIIDFQGEPSNVQAIQNAAKAEVYGFEAGIEINFSEAWQLTSQYSIVDGFEEDDDGTQNPIRHAAPIFGNTQLSFSKDKYRITAFALYNGQFDFEDLAPSQQNNAFLYATDRNGNPFSPSWYTLNLQTEYNITKALQLNVALENITDQRYRQYSSGIAAAGRNLIIAATYRF